MTIKPERLDEDSNNPDAQAVRNRADRPSRNTPNQRTSPHREPFKPKFTVHPKDGPEYNVRAARILPLKKTNVLDSVAHLVKGCLGGGIMGIHEAYSKAGLWIAVIFNVLFGIYIAYCVYILVHSAQVLYKKLHVPAMSFPDVAEASMETGPFVKMRPYARYFRYSVDLVIMIDLFGSCCVYMIIIAKTILQLVQHKESDAELGDDSIRMYIAMLLIPCLLIGMITSLKYLAPFSLLANFFIMVCVLATVYYGITLSGPLSDMPFYNGSPLGFFEFCGVVVFSMEGVGVSLPIENSMNEPHKFPIVLVLGQSCVTFFVFLVGFFGYWGFRENLQTPIHINFPKTMFPTILKVMMALMIYVTFAVNFWAPFNLAWYYLQKRYPPEKHWLWERVYRAIFICVISVIAIAFPNMGNLMGLLGSFCLSFMGFIFPATIETLIVWDDPGLGTMRWKLWKNILICMLGTVLLISGTYSNGKGLIASLLN